MRTPLCDLLGIRHPVLLAPTAAVSGDATSRSTLFDVARGIDWPPEWNMRALGNEFPRRWRDDEEGLVRSIMTERARYTEAADTDDVATAAVFIGEAVDPVRPVMSAGDILRTMISTAEARVRAVRMLAGGTDFWAAGRQLEGSLPAMRSRQGQA